MRGTSQHAKPHPDLVTIAAADDRGLERGLDSRLGRFGRNSWRGQCGTGSSAGMERLGRRPPCRRADHGHCVFAAPADHHLRRQGLDSARTGIERPERPGNAGRHFRRPRKRGRALFQSLRRRLHAAHAAPHLVGHRAAWRSVAGASGVPWLHSPALRIRRSAVRHHQGGHARDRGARRRGAGGHRAAGSVPGGRRRQRGA
jgi:hypothetical protein